MYGRKGFKKEGTFHLRAFLAAIFKYNLDIKVRPLAGGCHDVEDGVVAHRRQHERFDVPETFYEPTQPEMFIGVEDQTRVGRRSVVGSRRIADPAAEVRMLVKAVHVQSQAPRRVGFVAVAVTFLYIYIFLI